MQPKKPAKTRKNGRSWASQDRAQVGRASTERRLGEPVSKRGWANQYLKTNPFGRVGRTIEKKIRNVAAGVLHLICRKKGNPLAIEKKSETPPDPLGRPVPSPTFTTPLGRPLKQSETPPDPLGRPVPSPTFTTPSGRPVPPPNPLGKAEQKNRHVGRTNTKPKTPGPLGEPVLDKPEPIIKQRNNQKANRAIRVQSGCNQGAIRVQSGCNQGAIRVQSGCNQGAIRVQSGCNQGAIRVQKGATPKSCKNLQNRAQLGEPVSNTVGRVTINPTCPLGTAQKTPPQTDPPELCFFARMVPA